MSKKIIKQLAKILISVGLLYLVYTKIEFGSLISLYKTADPLLMAFAIILFVLSQMMSSIRLTYIFHSHSLHISQLSNLKLYFVGMFYNFFIPGGIGGDAYKIYLLKNKFNWSVKLLTKIILLDRLLGLIAICCISALLASNLFFNSWEFLILGIVVAILLYWIAQSIFKIFDNDIKKYYAKGFFYSIIIQLLQVSSVLLILGSIRVETLDFLGYGLVFLISSVASVISFSGFGIREYIFLKSAEFLGTEEIISTSIGFTFNLITSLISLIGIIFILTKLKLHLQPLTKNHEN